MHTSDRPIRSGRLRRFLTILLTLGLMAGATLTIAATTAVPAAADITMECPPGTTPSAGACVHFVNILQPPTSTTVYSCSVGVLTGTGPSSTCEQITRSPAECESWLVTVSSGYCIWLDDVTYTVPPGSSCGGGFEPVGGNPTVCYPQFLPYNCDYDEIWVGSNQHGERCEGITTSPAIGTVTYSCPPSTVPSGSGASMLCAASVPVTQPPVLHCAGQLATVILANLNLPTPGDDVIIGTPGNDVINGLGGNDVICGGDGDDTLRGGTGNDRLFGGDGEDRLFGDSGNDVLVGSDGHDFLVGQSGADSAIGGRGNDRIVAGDGNDRAWGGVGNDHIVGGPGIDVLRGGAGSDFIRGDQARDYIYGDAGNDNLYGSAGPDRLRGGDGNDNLFGGSSADALHGDDGTDYANGQGGVDICTAETFISC